MWTPPVSVHTADAPAHSAFVRLTHWITTASVAALIISGIAILIAHPRLYWGETGTVGAPSLIDLPLPFVLTGQTGWGRHLHFLAAWMLVVTGAAYLTYGIVVGHFVRDVLPSRADLSRESIASSVSTHTRFEIGRDQNVATYNVVQRLTYCLVIFVLFPLMIWTGLAMAPAVTSVAPIVVTTFGGHQSARTIHFVVAFALVVFIVVHVVMVCVTGFGRRMRAMTVGGRSRSTDI